jgi:hypothetical protein
MKLTQYVREALANAKENGYDFTGWSVEDIAVDMTTCDGTIEKYPLEEVIAAITEIQNSVDH